jgi:hypothetical protein
MWIGVALSLVGLAGIVLPSLFGLSGMEGAYALACASLLPLTAGLVTTWLYWDRARVAARILSGDGTLARWTYSEAQGRQQAESEFESATGQNRALYLIMVCWFVVISAALIGYDYYRNQEVNWPFAGAMLGMVLLLGFVAWFAPRLRRRQAHRGGRDVIIGRSGLILSGSLYPWGGSRHHLDNASLSEGPEGTGLEFTIRHRGVVPTQPDSLEIVRVSVPPDQLDAARKVVAELAGQG